MKFLSAGIIVIIIIIIIIIICNFDGDFAYVQFVEHEPLRGRR